MALIFLSANIISFLCVCFLILGRQEKYAALDQKSAIYFWPIYFLLSQSFIGAKNNAGRFALLFPLPAAVEKSAPVLFYFRPLFFVSAVFVWAKI